MTGGVYSFYTHSIPQFDFIIVLYKMNRFIFNHKWLSGIKRHIQFCIQQPFPRQFSAKYRHLRIVKFPQTIYSVNMIEMIVGKYYPPRLQIVLPHETANRSNVARVKQPTTSPLLLPQYKCIGIKKGVIYSENIEITLHPDIPERSLQLISTTINYQFLPPGC